MPTALEELQSPLSSGKPVSAPVRPMADLSVWPTPSGRRAYYINDLNTFEFSGGWKKGIGVELEEGLKHHLSTGRTILTSASLAFNPELVKLLGMLSEALAAGTFAFLSYKGTESLEHHWDHLVFNDSIARVGGFTPAGGTKWARTIRSVAEDCLCAEAPLLIVRGVMTEISTFCYHWLFSILNLSNSMKRELTDYFRKESETRGHINGTHWAGLASKFPSLSRYGALFVEIGRWVHDLSFCVVLGLDLFGPSFFVNVIHHSRGMKQLQYVGGAPSRNLNVFQWIAKRHHLNPPPSEMTNALAFSCDIFPNSQLDEGSEICRPADVSSPAPSSSAQAPVRRSCEGHPLECFLSSGSSDQFPKAIVEPIELDVVTFKPQEGTNHWVLKPEQLTVPPGEDDLPTFVAREVLSRHRFHLAIIEARPPSIIAAEKNVSIDALDGKRWRALRKILRSLTRGSCTISYWELAVAWCDWSSETDCWKERASKEAHNALSELNRTLNGCLKQYVKAGRRGSKCYMLTSFRFCHVIVKGAHSLLGNLTEEVGN